MATRPEASERPSTREPMRAVPPSCVNVATLPVVVSVPVDSDVARRTTEASKRPRLKVNAPVLIVLVVPPV